MIRITFFVRRSLKSLRRTRRIHLFTSQQSDKAGDGVIPQGVMSIAIFGFMGYALVRPHMLSIAHDNNEDRAAFLHFWAVISHMMGIKPEFNLCLQPLEVAEM